MSAPHAFPADAQAHVRRAVAAFDRGDQDGAIAEAQAAVAASTTSEARVFGGFIMALAILPDVPGRSGLRALLPAIGHSLTGADVLSLANDDMLARIGMTDQPLAPVVAFPD